ncbi:RNase R [Gammaproteobacteria bacterium]
MSKLKSDPFQAREAQQYEQPIPSREFVLAHLAERRVPLTEAILAEELELSTERERDALRRRLRAMERDGQVVCNRREGYGLPKKMDLVTGRVTAHRDGYGFLIPDHGGTDLFLHARQMASLMHGDRILAQVVGVDQRGRREGAVVEVLERAVHKAVGRFLVESGSAFVIPSEKRLHRDILIPPEHRGEARPGQIVTVEILEQPTTHRQPIGRVTEVLGEHLAPGMEIDIAIRAFELPDTWPPEVEREAAAFPFEVTAEAARGREDLRTLPLVTIDGEDARDFDDAVYCEPEGKGWRLIVAIADVSAYVTPGSALDQEARNRGNSVYFPERAIPMLPEVLSNGLCSLNPLVDRLCMACELHLGPRGKVLAFRFFPAVMRSAARLTYTVVAAILDGDAPLHQEYTALIPHLHHLHTLYKILRKRREGRGAMDFDTLETRIVFGSDRKIERIVPVIRNDAHRLIEECMITANVAAAEFLTSYRIPLLYRIHEGPDAVKLDALRQFLGAWGLSLGGEDEPQPKDFAKVLEQVEGRLDAHLIQTVLLRSLSQAVYTPENKGHFGLAFNAYTHFTSPIRRYPDLLVHRAIRHVLAGGLPREFGYSSSDMERFGEHCSMTERRADEATWDVVSWLKCEYMQDKVGEEFDGVISSITSFGLFVELKDIYVEGLIHITSLANDYYHFDPIHHRLTGERTRHIFRLGDPLRVQVIAVNLDDRKIDFIPADAAFVGEKKKAKGKNFKESKTPLHVRSY